MKIEPIVLAGPIFLLLIAIEYLYGRWRERETYRLGDTINSLSCGVMSQVIQLGAKVGVYGWLLPHVAMFHPAMDSVWVWGFALLLYDFCYYWSHRFSHEMNLFWADHVVHHQSERFNLSTALRQPSIVGTILPGFIFYLPMALCGFPVEAMAVVGMIDLYYQYWVHTEHIGKLGWVDRIFVTPSNHRVHHAVNDRYLDKNYGGVLIIWDRMFGSYAEERDDTPVVYGTRSPLRSWNPVWANLEVFWSLAKDAWRARRWRDKLFIWVARTGWRPQDVAERYPKSAFDINREEYNPPLAWALGAYCLLHSLLIVGISLYLLAIATSLVPSLKLAGVLYVTFGFVSLGWLMEGRPAARWMELFRALLTTSILLWFVLPEFQTTSILALSICAINVGWLFWTLARQPAVDNTR